MSFTQAALASDFQAILDDWSAIGGETVTRRQRLSVTRSTSGASKETWTQASTTAGEVQGLSAYVVAQTEASGTKASGRRALYYPSSEDARAGDRVVTNRTTYEIEDVQKAENHVFCVIAEIQVADA